MYDVIFNQLNICRLIVGKLWYKRNKKPVDGLL